MIVFIDGPAGKPSQGVHMVIAGRKIREDYIDPAPEIGDSQVLHGRRTLALEQLVRMKLNSYRLNDRTHLVDMIQLGLIDSSWLPRFEPVLLERLRELLENSDA